MGFQRSVIIVARILRLIGTDGRRIIGTTTFGQPRIDLYTGSASEIAPGSFSAADEDLANDAAWVEVRSPELNAIAGPTTLRLLAREDGEREIQVLSDSFVLEADADFRIENIGGGGLVIDNQAGSGPLTLLGAGGQVVELPEAGGIDVSGAGLTFPDGRRIIGFDGGPVSDNASGGNGTVNFPHNLGAETGGETNHFVVNRSGASNSWLNRFPAGDTGATFQCRATLHDNTAPANGTNITGVFTGMRFAP